MTPSSPSISLTSPSTPDPSSSVVVSFAQDQSSSLPHTMVEDKSISQDELHTTFFPPSSRINVPSTSGSIQNSKWSCQWENCHDLVRSQDRMAHALEHYGKKRFTCSWLALISFKEKNKELSRFLTLNIAVVILLRGHKTRNVICESKPFVIYGMFIQFGLSRREKIDSITNSQLRPVGRNGKEGRCPSCRSLSTLRR